SALEVVDAAEAEDSRQLVERRQRLAPEAHVGEVFAGEPVAIVALDPTFQLGAELLVPEDARPDRRALLVGEDDPLPQAGRAAAVLHRLAQVEVMDARDRRRLEEAPRARILARLDRRDDGHASVRKREQL